MQAYCRYTFLCGYGPYSWEVRCRFSEVAALHDRIDREAAACGIPGPTRRYTLLPQVKSNEAVDPIALPAEPTPLPRLSRHHLFPPRRSHPPPHRLPFLHFPHLALRVLVASRPSRPFQRHETRPEFLVQRHREVIGYLQAVVGTEKLWALQPVRAFFEVHRLLALGADLAYLFNATTRRVNAITCWFTGATYRANVITNRWARGASTRTSARRARRAGSR